MTKSAASCGFGNIYWRNPELRNLSFVQCGSKIWWNQPSIFISCALILGFLNLSKIFYAGLQKTNYDKYSQMILREKCPYSELFWSLFSRIRTEYGEIRSISPYSARMWENTDQNKSEYGHSLRKWFYHISPQLSLFRLNMRKHV